MPSLKVDDYSRQVIDNYRTNAQHMDPSTAKAATVYAASAIAADEGRARSGDAAKVAKTAIETFEKDSKQGVPVEKARENAARSMAEQFDSRGREVPKERERSNALGL
jgi:hypothetical protein